MLRIIVIAILVLVVFFCGWLWFAPSGEGEYGDSPNARVRAHMSILSRGTIFGTRIEYLEVRVVDSIGGETILTADYYEFPGAERPNFSNRHTRSIAWAPDSSSVTFQLGGKHQVTFPIPIK
jgi:hypothetical protein